MCIRDRSKVGFKMYARFLRIFFLRSVWMSGLARLYCITKTEKADVICTLYPHITHKIQPSDLAVFGHLNRKAASEWMISLSSVNNFLTEK